MTKVEGDSVAEDNAYQAALGAGMRYVVMGNDGKTQPTYYASWQEATLAAMFLTGTSPEGDAFWVEAA